MAEYITKENAIAKLEKFARDPLESGRNAGRNRLLQFWRKERR